MKAAILTIALATSVLAGEHKSSFEPQDSGRNPFLPIGYVRPVKQLPRENFLDIRPEMFNVTAILLGDPSLAIINGKDRGIGDKIPLNATGSEYVTVQSIKDGKVTLQTRQGNAVLVGLRK